MNFVIDTLGSGPAVISPEIDELKLTGSSFGKTVMQMYRESKKGLDLSLIKPTTPAKTDIKKPKKKKLEITLDSNFHEAIKAKSRPNIDEILKKCVLTEEFEKAHAVPDADTSKRLIQKKRKLEASKTKGSNWFNLPATEITEEVKRDLEVLQMRSVLDPKHFYKKNDLKVLPKYFQVGKVMDSHMEFYNNRLTKKQRKGTLVDELLADAEFQKYNKRKYKEIIEEKQKTHYKAYKQAKKLKRKNKK